MKDGVEIKKQCIFVKSGKFEVSLEKPLKESLRKLVDFLKEYFQSTANVYAVMDHAVAFGRYENSSIHVVLGSTAQIEDLPFDYVRELRVFDENQEMRIVRSNEDLIWRLLRDLGEPKDYTAEMYYMDEQHKLWGKVTTKDKCSEEVNSSWSYLTSGRGTSLFVYGKHDNGTEIGLRIRNYIEFTDAKKKDEIKDETGIIHFVDERLIGFEPWKEES